jgi:glycogen synthase
MRILFLSNYYPPAGHGGYEQWCQEVASELVNRGHYVSVVTSRWHAPRSAAPKGMEVHRLLRLEVESGLLSTAARVVLHRTQFELENGCNLRCVLERFKPDVALIWGMWNVSRAVPALVEERMPGRAAYYICDYWLSLPSQYVQQWQAPAARRWAEPLKAVLARPILKHLLREEPSALRLEHPICVSHGVRARLVAGGVPVPHAQVIYGGTQTDEFAAAAAGRECAGAHALRLVYAGRLEPEKGIATIIRALALLPAPILAQTTLDVIGRGKPRYERALKQMVVEQGVQDRVSFQGAVLHREMPSTMANYDALILASEWEEPFARIVLEAMAAGLVVIGTTTGGTGEVLVHDETGLAFPAGNARALAEQMSRLSADHVLRERLARAGCETVRARFTLSRMVTEIEQYLEHLAAG